MAHPASLPPYLVFPSCVSSFFSGGAVLHLVRPHIIRPYHCPRGCAAPVIRGPTWVRLVWWRYARLLVVVLSRRYDLSLEWTCTVWSRQRKEILKRVVVVVEDRCITCSVIGTYCKSACRRCFMLTCMPTTKTQRNAESGSVSHR